MWTGVRATNRKTLSDLNIIIIIYNNIIVVSPQRFKYYIDGKYIPRAQRYGRDNIIINILMHYECSF